MKKKFKKMQINFFKITNKAKKELDKKLLLIIKITLQHIQTIKQLMYYV